MDPEILFYILKSHFADTKGIGGYPTTFLMQLLPARDIVAMVAIIQLSGASVVRGFDVLYAFDSSVSQEKKQPAWFGLLLMSQIHDRY